jgi:hypothetical protein
MHIRKIALFAAAVAALSATNAHAGLFGRRAANGYQVQQAQVTQKTITTTASTLTAQNAALIIAREGRLRHLGGHGGFEGIGFSTSSPDAAISNCCFWGKRQPLEIATARGVNGWFAVVRYR